ncbi:hypothetical protein J45TS6_24630 [Paenibacillus sp. J45TS6]|uniref:hypothetical protein n=1 Tax=unclassified Paenibacillus TaxID=185978 RepID=UPI001B0572A6|nr:hypothetical protein [Paenibacillus sp. J45TS6]GIP44004.1 hypothetical protein J45TS6_24630 [Paenibacillus sp. J45TS6]
MNRIKAQWAYNFYRSDKPIPYEEVEDHGDAVDLIDLPSDIQKELQAAMPQFFITTPDPEHIEYELVPNESEFVLPALQPLTEIEQINKRLFAIKVPEFKIAACKNAFKTPFGKVKFTYPCLKRRDSELTIYAYMKFPNHLDQFIINELQGCFDLASNAANEVAVEAFHSGKGSPIERVIKAVPATIEVFKSTFIHCVVNAESWKIIENDVVYGVDFDQTRLTDWY